MQSVLGLVPDRAGRAVDDLVGDLEAAVGWQAVQHDRAGRGPAEQGVVDLERAERADPVEAVVLLAHRRPGVGDQDVGAVDGGVRVAEQGDDAAGFGGALLGVADDVGMRRETGGGGDAARACRR